MVSNDTNMRQGEFARIESRTEISTYLQNLRYALEHGAVISLQHERQIDRNREPKYTNRYTVENLFPGEKWEDALRRELASLTIEEYMRTVKDLRYPERSEMREFGRSYYGTDDVYIKIRVELLSADGYHTTFVMSFHYAMYPFTSEEFPYGNGERPDEEDKSSK